MPKGQTTAEVADGTISLRPEEADAARLLALVRGHWHIETRLHYVCDVILGGCLFECAAGLALRCLKNRKIL